MISLISLLIMIKLNVITHEFGEFYIYIIRWTSNHNASQLRSENSNQARSKTSGFTAL